jgi:acyl-CoA synthetase (AMP-forming)/AMP-acid ligase II
MSHRLILKELSRYNIGTYADIIYRNALLRSGKEAFVYGPKRVTFAEFNDRVNSLVNALTSLGLKKGDGIGLVSWNCLECTDVVGAAMKGGFIVSPFNPRMQPQELEYIINDSQVKVLFVGTELIETIEQLKPRLSEVKEYISLEREFAGMHYHDKLLAAFPKEEPAAVVEESDPFIIFYTSGTTGVPRGAVYTHYRKHVNHRPSAGEQTYHDPSPLSYRRLVTFLGLFLYRGVKRDHASALFRRGSNTKNPCRRARDGHTYCAHPSCQPPRCA